MCVELFYELSYFFEMLVDFLVFIVGAPFNYLEFNSIIYLFFPTNNNIIDIKQSQMASHDFISVIE